MPCTHACSQLVAVLLTGAVLAPSAAARQVRYDAEVFAPPGSQPSLYAFGMNEQGVIVGHAGDDRYDPRAAPIAVLNGRVLEGPRPNESLNFLFGLGRADLVVGTSSTFPFVWKRGVPQQLRPAGGLPQGSAYDANTRGVICGEVYRDFTGDYYPVVWPSAGARGIRLPGVGDSRQGAAFAINESNQVAGAVRNVGGYAFVAARWDSLNTPPRVLGVLPGAMNSEGLSINSHGDVAGRSSFPDLTIQAFVYLDATNSITGLGHLGGGYSLAHGVNDARQVVGESTVNGEVHGFIWHEGVMRDLNDLIRNTSEPILYVSNAVAIDSRGRIAAEVQIADGFGTATRIALLTPAP
ncbi:MAG: hypothetical protein KJZ69_11105 [Phycisphaerales bacterium]|nr:hypothetical protein [Phycisphaerales bacterium]